VAIVKIRLQRLQFLARLESNGFSGRNANLLAGARIASDAGLSRAHIEHTEAAQLDSFAFAERFLHGIENSFDGLLGLGSAHAGLVHNGIHDIKFNHANLQRFNGKLC